MDFKDLMADEVEDMENDIEKTSEAVDQENQSEVVEDTTENEDANEEVYEEDTASEDDLKEKKSFFKKKEKKDKKDEKIDELTDRLMRNMAEFENFRKRTEKEKSQMFEIGAKDIIERILPVIDNFERGLAAVTIEEKESAFVQGIEKIYKQLVTTLEAAGVKQIEAVGKEFDPDFHNAVMHSEDEEYGENIVSEEFQKGYMYRETVVRHSMVKVVN